MKDRKLKSKSRKSVKPAEECANDKADKHSLRPGPCDDPAVEIRKAIERARSVSC